MPRRLVRIPTVGRFIAPIGEEFVSVEALGGLAVVGAAIAAMLWANLASDSYTELWTHGLTVGVGDAAIALDLRHWLNDGLMMIFFFVVGLEIKRELVIGDLRDPRAAALPVLGACGGMVVPAVIFVALNFGSDAARGWAIPMATDIALAIGVLGLVGSLVHPKVKLFLLTLAIVDDIGAIVVIALFYARSISPIWIVASLATIVLIVGLRRAQVATPLAYLGPAIVLWVCVHESGVHATIAGVILGLLTPARPFKGRAVLERLERRLHPISSFVIVPVFALANAGVVLTRSGIERTLGGRVGLGIIIGLVVGKTLGILVAAAAGVRFKLGRLPDGVRLSQIAAVATVAGIGFTVSLFVADLSYRSERLEEAKIGILVASLLAGTLGMLWISVLGTRTSRSGEPRT